MRNPGGAGRARRLRAGRAGASRHRPAPLALALAALLAAVLGACGGPPRAAPAPVADAVTHPPLPGDAAATLASVRRLDDHPLFTMTYHGDYDALAPLPAAAQAPPPQPWGCSLFVAGGDPRRPLVGRNFDWYDNPALLLFTDPPDGYASVSMVDLSYLGFDRSSRPDLAPAEQRRALLQAPLLPFDGLNEHGLAVGMAAVPTADAGSDPAKPTVSGVRVIRLMLDGARTVDEAVALLGRHNLDFSGGPPLHYLLADATGHAAVVEFVGGRPTVLRNQRPWLAATNFQLDGATAAAKQGDRRYRTAASELERAGGALTWRQAMDLLASVAQGHTRWSVVYGLRSGEIRLVMNRDYDVVRSFRLAMR